MASFSPVLPYHQEQYPAIGPTRPELSTKGKSVLITGAGSGIGAETANAFAKSGVSHLGIVGRRAANLEDTRSKIAASYPDVTVHVIPGDMTSIPFIYLSAKDIDVLVANAGYIDKIQPLDSTDPEDWWRTFEINVRGNYNLLRAFTPVAAPGAVVLHTSTTIAHLPYVPGYSAYQASKLAAIKVFDNFAVEHPGVRVIHYHPGLYRTEIGSTTEEAGLGIPFDDLSLAGGFAVWAASPEAAFLDKRFVFAHWDVDTLKSLAAELAANPSKFTIVLSGFPQ